MHGDMIRFIAFDFVLRLIGIGMMAVSFVVDVVRVNPDNPAADAPGLGIPAHVIAHFEFFAHAGNRRTPRLFVLENSGTAK